MHLDPDGSLSGALIDGRYRVEHCIGSGGMGVVWRVHHIGSRQAFALKTLRARASRDRKAVRRVLQEARVAAAISSRHVVRVVDVKPDYVHDGAPLPFIVMELLEGRTLSDYLASVQRLTPAQLVWLMRFVSRGLSRAHERGVVHRDLKPSNVFLAHDDDDGVVVKLCDFGIAKLYADVGSEPGEPSTLSTETGMILGTPRYMAPEQLRRGGNQGPATDQWAFALVAFRVLTGRGYFEHAQHMAELVLAIVHDPLPKPSQLAALNADFDAWFERSCARDPAQRFNGIDEQQRALELALGDPEPDPIQLAPERAAAPEASLGSTEARGQPTHRLTRLGSYAALAGAAALSLAMANQLADDLSRGPVARPAPGPSVTRVEPTQLAPSTTSAATATATPSALPSSAPPPRKRWVPARPKLLPAGAACKRSSECRDGLCAAEVCQ